MNYVASSHPLETESAYPYKGVDATCAYSSSKGVGALTGTGYKAITTNSGSALASAVASNPISVLIEAD